jgi:glycosyltransferase involved in cell wall biosynthesis
MSKAEPLVSIVTPAFNAGPYIRECIESALAQSYGTFEHIIFDNASTDDTLAIAQSFAARDPRIRVKSRREAVSFVENWNSVLREISPAARYCQTLHADDWLYPQCLERLVDLGERYPDVGIVGSLRLRGDSVQCRGLPEATSVFPGRDIGRLFLRGEIFAIAPTTNMVRTDLIRRREPFYDARYLHTDLAAYLDLLADTHFGFCHEVLSFSRTHETSITRTVAERRQTLVREWPALLENYGSRYFSSDELRTLFQSHYRRHYRILVRALLTGGGVDFLKYHLDGMQAAGHRPALGSFLGAFAAEVREALSRPRKALRHICKLRRSG